jgi:hypothetical protein
VLQDCVSYLDLCHAVHQQTSDASGCKEQHCFLSWQFSTNVHLSASPNIVPIVLWADDIFRLLFLCDAVLCRPMLGRCIVGSKRRNQPSPPALYSEEIYRSVQHTVAGTVREHCFAEDCATAASEESSGHIFNGIPPPRGPHAASFQFLLPFA